MARSCARCAPSITSWCQSHSVRIDEAALEGERRKGRVDDQLVLEVVHPAFAVGLDRGLALQPADSLEAALLGAVDLDPEAEGPVGVRRGIVVSLT